MKSSINNNCCSNCSHANICKYAEKVKEFENRVGEMRIDIPDQIIQVSITCIAFDPQSYIGK